MAEGCNPPEPNLVIYLVMLSISCNPEPNTLITYKPKSWDGMMDPPSWLGSMVIGSVGYFTNLEYNPFTSVGGNNYH